MKFDKLLFVACILFAVAFTGSCGSMRSSDSTSELKEIASWEDCVGLDFRTARVARVGSSWKIVEGPGGRHYAFDFGANRSEAQKALNVIKRYRVMHSCYVGRPDPSLKYLLIGGGNAPRGNRIANEDCTSFNNSNVRVRWYPGRNSWKMVDGNMWMVDFGTNRSEAYTALRVVRKHKFNRQCFVGRPDPSFSYWKKVGNIVPARRPDLGAYGFLKIGQNGGRLVRWNETIVLRPHDSFLTSGGQSAFNLFYSEKNYGQASASGYANRFYFDSALVSQQQNRPILNPAQKRDIHTQAYMRPGPGIHWLRLEIDDSNAVSESRENNNTFRVRVRFVGF